MRAEVITNGQHLLKATSRDWAAHNAWDRGHEVVVIDRRHVWTTTWYDSGTDHAVTLPDGRIVMVPAGIQDRLAEYKDYGILVQDPRTGKYEVARTRDLRGDIVACSYLQASIDDILWQTERKAQAEHRKRDAIMEPLMLALTNAGIIASRSSLGLAVIFDEDGVRKLTAILEERTQ